MTISIVINTVLCKAEECQICKIDFEPFEKAIRIYNQKTKISIYYHTKCYWDRKKKEREADKK